MTATFQIFNSAHSDNDLVHQSVDVSAFEGRLPAVHHQFCVASGEDHQSIAPACVADDTAAKKDLIVVQRVRLLVPRQSSFVLAEHVVRRLAHNFACKTIQRLNPVFKDQLFIILHSCWQLADSTRWV